MQQDLKQIMRDHYLKYASYVILDRAIPNIADGLKPGGVMYQEAMRRAEEIQAKKLGQTPAEQAAATQANAAMANAQASSAAALQPAATISVPGAHEGMVQSPHHDLVLET